MTVAVGDVDGDNLPEIITGAGVTGGPQVSIFDRSGQSQPAFFAYASDFRGGVRVTTADLTGDGVDEIITGTGPSGAPLVNVYSVPYPGASLSLMGFDAGQNTGIWIEGTCHSLNLAPTSAAFVSKSYENLRQLIANHQPIFAQFMIANRPAVPFWEPEFNLDDYWEHHLWSNPMFLDAPNLFLTSEHFYRPTFFASPLYFGDPRYLAAPIYYDDFGEPFEPSHFDDWGYPLDDGYLILGGNGNPIVYVHHDDDRWDDDHDDHHRFHFDD